MQDTTNLTVTGLAQPSHPYLENRRNFERDCLIQGSLGGFAGLLMEGFLHPIDTIRTRVKANTKETVSMMKQIRLMHRYEGAFSYFNGFSCTLGGAFASNAAYFYIYEKLKYMSLQSNMLTKDTAPFVAAFIAGFTSNFISLPFDVVRTRMQLKPGYYDYRGFTDGAKKILKLEGFNKLYAGGTCFFTLNALETSLTFGFYELFYRGLEPLFPTQMDVNIPLSIVASVSAASLAGFIINPLDVMVTRMQAVCGHKAKTPCTVTNMTKKIWKNEGMAGFFKGVSGTMAYYAMSALILFPTYEVLKAVSKVDLSK